MDVWVGASRGAGDPEPLPRDKRNHFPEQQEGAQEAFGPLPIPPSLCLVSIYFST